MADDLHEWEPDGECEYCHLTYSLLGFWNGLSRKNKGLLATLIIDSARELADAVRNETSLFDDLNLEVRSCLLDLTMQLNGGPRKAEEVFVDLGELRDRIRPQAFDEMVSRNISMTLAGLVALAIDRFLDPEAPVSIGPLVLAAVARPADIEDVRVLLEQEGSQAH